MALPPELLEIWPVLLGVALQLGVAAWTVVLAPRDLRHQVFAFLLCANAAWDLAGALVNQTTGVARLGYLRVDNDFSLWSMGALAAFLLVYPAPRRHARIGIAAIAGLVVVAEALFWWRPTLYSAQYVGLPPRTGPLLLLDLFWLPLLVAGAIGILLRERRRHSSDIAPLLVALALLVYALGGWGALWSGQFAQDLARGNPYSDVRLSGMMIARLLAEPVALWALVALARHPRGGLRPASILGALLTFLFLLRVVPGFGVGWPTLAPLVFGLIVAYALARGRLFDIDLKLKVTLSRGTVVGAFVAVFFVATQVAQNFLEGYGPLVGGVAAGLLLFALQPLQRAADRVAERAMPGVHPTPEYVGARKHDVYRAALEGALADGTVTDKEREILTRLQLELGIANAEARAMEEELLGRARAA